MSNTGHKEIRGIVGATDIDECEVLSFQIREYPTRDRERILPVWHWAFFDSAARFSSEPMVWMYRRKGEIVAHQGALTVEVKVGDKRCVTGWFVETMAAESVRGRAIGSMVVQKALEELPFNLSLGQTELMRKLQFSLGWRQVIPLNAYMYVLNPDNVLSGKIVNRGLRYLTARLLIMVRYMRGLGMAKPASQEYMRGTLEGFDPEYDVLWERVEKYYQCTVCRDSGYMNWRYRDQPGKTYTCLTVARDDLLEGVAVISIAEPDEAYGYRRGMIAELVVSPDDRKAVYALLNAVKSYFVESNVDMMLCHQSGQTMIKHLERFGFVSRGPRHYFLVAGNDQDESLKEAFVANNWFLTMGDSDQLSPW